jgi:oligoribonuclease
MQTRFDFPARDCNQDRIVWLDLELCSLENHRVLECAVILTTCNEVEEVARKNWVIGMAGHEIDTQIFGGAAADFHVEHSNSNGLIQACLHSPTTQEEWQRELLVFLQSHCQHRPRLAGFSVHVDREVLRTQAPEVYRFVSHQIIDVSTLDILQWGLPPLEGAARSYNGRQGNHRAMPDSEAAIAKLKWYLRWLKDRLTSGGSETNESYSY